MALHLYRATGTALPKSAAYLLIDKYEHSLSSFAWSRNQPEDIIYSPGLPYGMKLRLGPYLKSPFLAPAPFLFHFPPVPYLPISPVSLSLQNHLQKKPLIWGLLLENLIKDIVSKRTIYKALRSLIWLLSLVSWSFPSVNELCMYLPCGLPGGEKTWLLSETSQCRPAKKLMAWCKGLTWALWKNRWELTKERRVIWRFKYMFIAEMSELQVQPRD